MKFKSANTPGKAGNQDHFTALRAQADRERVRARRGQGSQNDLLAKSQGDSHSGLYSDEMMVDAPAQNAPKKKNNQRRERR
jgi:hypothetical protein